MAKVTTLGREKVRQALPPKYRDFQGALDKKALSKLYTRLAKEDPDQYEDVLHRLNTIGVNTASLYGRSASLSVDDFKVPEEIAARRDALKKQVAAVYDSPLLTPEQKSKTVLQMVEKFSETIDEDLLAAVSAKDGAFALQINSGSRGKPFQLRQLLLGNLISADSRGHAVPYPNLDGYAGGISPLAYLAAAHGSRRGNTDVQFATADMGYLCLAEGTMVRMADLTERPIQSLRLGDLVMGSDMQGNVRPVAVTAVFCNGVKPVETYIFGKGRSKETVSITATPDHNILVTMKRGTRFAGERKTPLRLITRGLSALPPQTVKLANKSRVGDLAYVIGALIGDGGLTGHNVTLSCADLLMLKHLQSLDCVALKQITRPSTVYPDIEYSVRSTEEYTLARGSGGRVLEGAVEPLRVMLDKLGLLHRKSHEKRLCAEILHTWGSEDLAELLAGIYDTDGCVTHTNYGSLPVIKLGVTSRELVEDVKFILEKVFGVYSSSVVESKPAKEKQMRKYPELSVTGRRPAYHITIANADSIARFIKYIPLRGAKKDKLHKAYAAYTPSDKRNSYTYVLRSMVAAGSAMTYDIEVDHPDHLFVLASGLIVSNSKQLTNVSHRSVVTEEDCGTTAGIELDGDDVDNVGTVLAQDVAGLKAGTILDEDNTALIKDKKILGRSALTCQAKQGVCAKCAGVRETGALPSIGDSVGVTGARSFIEPLTQGAIGCLAPDTEVRMADGSVKRMDELVVGDRILGADESANTYVTTVKHVFDKGVKDIYRTTYRQSSSRNADPIHIDCTLDHKILQATYTSGQKEDVHNNIPRQLRCGKKRRRISAILQNGFTCDDQYTHEPMALLLGLLIGDGCYTASVNGVHFSCADESLIDETREYMARLQLKFTKLEGHPYYYRVSMLDGTSNMDVQRDPETGRMLPGTRNPIKKYLQDTGMYGKYAFEKELPPAVFSWDNASVAQLLAGLYITDGCVLKGHTGNPFFSFSSTSRVLVEQIKDLLRLRFGIYTSRLKQDKNMVCQFGDRVSIRRHPMWSITVASADSVGKFIDTIPLQGVKAAKVRDIGFKGARSVRANYRCARQEQTFLRTGPVMDIEVSAESPLFVLANGMIVSNSKHSAGEIGSTQKTERGFKAVNKFFQVPKEFPGEAALAEVDGRVSAISKAPQGGTIVSIGSKQHYIPSGYDVTVKQGDTVEAGDLISSGMLNAARIVKHKGIGEGRMYFLQHLRKLLDDSGGGTHRRNLEYLTSRFINKVRITDPDGVNGYLPDDVIDYSTLASEYQPREGAALKSITTANKLYLEKPYLHYTIGTRVTPRIAKRMQAAGIKTVLAHHTPPPFEPEVIRAQDYMSADPDFQTQLAGENLKRVLTRAATRGAMSERQSISYFPRLVNIEEV